ncbi:MAG: dihydropteroate synthase [Candidatus Omnitrophica bacterium]|nr:dihydropteroate synthase [Candidatus Omnitrophota bacterium]
MQILPLVIHKEQTARQLLCSLGVSLGGVKILSPKAVFSAFKIEGISSPAANIVKQHLLSLGSDAALSREVLIKNVKTSIIIFGSIKQLRALCDKLKNQPFGLKEVSKELSMGLNNIYSEPKLKIRGKVLSLKKPVICAIVNLTPDSFSGDGLLRGSPKKNKDAALRQAYQMVKAGAKIIDIGGESSRPFSKSISSSLEKKRVIPILKALRKEFKKVFISIDTYKYEVAKAAAGAGADIINDITSLRQSPKIASLIKQYRLGIVLMHMQGKPNTMQANPKYNDVVSEVSSFFQERLKFCYSKSIEKESIIVDPGIGFGKRLEDNLKLINRLDSFRILGRPIFVGLSRKSFIGKALSLEVCERLIPTVAANTVAVIRGANILRVHDVSQARQALDITSQIMGN